MPDPNRGRAARAVGRLREYLSCLRYADILALQGPPLLGAAFALPELGRRELLDLLLLAVANLLLVAHVFVLNDWAGVDADLNDANKKAGAFTSRGLSGRGIVGLWLALLVASLGCFARLGLRALLCAGAIAMLSALYSAPRVAVKGRPILGSALHLVGGALHCLLGVAVFRAIDAPALAIALLCGLAFAAGHVTQEVRDFEGDRSNGISTNAVVFGRRRAFFAGLAVFAATYAELALLAVVGIFPHALAVLGGLFVAHAYWSREALAEGLSFDGIRRLQSRYRMIFAAIGVALVSMFLLAAARR